MDMTRPNVDYEELPAIAGPMGLEALGAADLRFRRMVEHLPAIVYVETGGHPGPTVYLSPRIEDVLGYTADRFLSGDDALWTEIMHPDDASHAFELDGRSEETREPYVADYRLRARDGRWVWFHDEAVFIPADGEIPAHWQGVMVDITEQKRLEQELEDSAATFRTLVGQLPAVVYIESANDAEGMLYMSPQYERWFGYSPEERVADPSLWRRLVHPDDQEGVLAAADRAIGSSGTFSMDYRMVARDGRILWVHDETYPIFDEEGRERVWLGVMFDVTERKRAEQDLERALLLERDASQQLRRADDIKNTFLQAVSHDLRSPLTAMLGSALTLEREDELGLQPEDRRDLIRGIATKTKKLVAIVSDLLDLERLSGGHLKPNRSTQDVGKLVARVIAESDVLAGRPVHVDTEPVRLPVDALMVERIVENLLANAAKHTPPETTVWVRVRSRSDGAVISVEDNGPGIEADRHDQIFAAFERGAEGSTNVPGVGLGLSLVLRFAELHGGRAWLEDREGGGASFRVFLPTAEAGELSSSRDRAASA
jgi:PAS domain S-box-containing protein